MLRRGAGAGCIGELEVTVLLPGDWVRVRPWPQVAATLNADQGLDGLTFMPEMLPYCGQKLRVALRAERTCVHPPELPFRRLEDAVVLQGVRCDGSFHGGCQLGCMVFWKEAWLEPLSARTTTEAGATAAGTAAAGDAEPTMPEVGLRAVSPSDPDRYVCQATALPAATRPGAPFWTPGQYVRMLRVRTFTFRGLLSMFARPARRRVVRLLGSALGRHARPEIGGEAASRLQPGDWVEVRSRDEILRTLDEHGTQRGLAFGGDMAEQCGRRMRVRERVDRIVVEATGRLRTVNDTVTLDGSVCDRYLGCARGMPFLWREAWLRPVEAPVAVGGDRAPLPAAPGGGSRVRRWTLAVKRGVDIAGASAACVILAPVLAWTALLVAATDGLPILFRHERPGLHGLPFTIYKFRTMRPPKPGEVWYLTDDDRISRLGRFLRASSIDELPELWNVLRGDMSLVGPRPLLAEYLPTYTPEERRRHDMRPGITGWAAVNGRHALRFEDRLKLDVWYIDHWSLWLDLRIIAMTVGHVLRRTHVSTTQDLEAIGFPLPGVGGAPLESPARAAGGQEAIGPPTATDAADRQSVGVGG